MERRAAGSADSASPPLQIVSLSPARSPLLLCEAVTQTGWAVLLPLAALPSLVPPPLPSPPVPPSSFQSLPPSLLSPLVIKENSSWPDLTSNAVPRPRPPPLSSPRRSPSIQPRMPGAPDRGTHKKPRFLFIPFNFAHSVAVSHQNTILQLWLLQNASYHSCPRIEDSGVKGRALEDGANSDNLEIDPLSKK